MPKNIIFDWAGVINDNFTNAYATICDIFDYEKVPRISAAELRREWCQPYMNFYNKYFPEMALEKEQSLFHKFIKDHYGYKPYPGMVELLKSLKEKGYKLVILSSDPTDLLMGLLDEYGIREVFDRVYTDVHDKTTVIQKVLKENNFNPEETVIIGDTPHEIETGQQAGIKTVGVTWGFKDESSLKEAGADFITHDVDELKRIIF